MSMPVNREDYVFAPDLMARVRYGAYVPHQKVTSDPQGDSRTRQEFAAECDINTILKRFEKTGAVSHINPRRPQYLDLPGDIDFQVAMNVMADAERAFMSLPARVRSEFENDPQKFVLFAQNPENLPKLRELGLAKPLEAPREPVEVRVVGEEPEDERTASKPSGARSRAKSRHSDAE